MPTEIIVAIITAVPTLIVAVVSVLSNTKVLEVKIQDLSQRVEKHNNIVERTYKLESEMGTVWKRYDDMKADVAEIAEYIRKERKDGR